MALPTARPNGHEPTTQVFAITGMLQHPGFRMHVQADDFVYAHLDGDDPYLLLRRDLETGAVTVALRLDWEGVFTLLANDDAAADSLFDECLAPAAPDEVQRQWTGEPVTLDLYRAWLQQQ
ncbi:MAG: hypothetical protein ACRD1F_11715 [Terriglobales bacterium]